ncbi:MAG: cell division protein SepF [Bacillota bacterium]|nr:cell division protein SepF [Bacillota bacterium]
MPEFINRLFGRYGQDEDDYDYEDELAENLEDRYEDQREPLRETIARSGFGRRSDKVVDFRSTGSQQLIVIKPTNIEAAKDISNHLRAGRTVVCNFERVDPDVAQRIVDFVYGATCALDGRVEQIASFIFVIVPRSVTVLDGREERDSQLDYLYRSSVSH